MGLQHGPFLSPDVVVSTCDQSPESAHLWGALWPKTLRWSVSHKTRHNARSFHGVATAFRGGCIVLRAFSGRISTPKSRDVACFGQRAVSALLQVLRFLTRPQNRHAPTQCSPAYSARGNFSRTSLLTFPSRCSKIPRHACATRVWAGIIET